MEPADTEGQWSYAILSMYEASEDLWVSWNESPTDTEGWLY